MSRRRRSTGRSRASWAGLLADQVLSGASNVLAVVLVARVLSPADFGRFALAHSALVFVLGASRLYLGNRLVLAADAQAVRRLTDALLGSLVLLSPVLVLGVLAVSVLAVGTGSLGLIAVVALATPVVCAQDLVRVACASTGRPGAALASDGLWVAGMAGALLVPASATTVLACWAGAAAAAALLAVALAGARPRLSRGLVELRRRDDQGGRLALGGVVSSLATLALLWGVALLSADRDAGSLRAAATVLGPVNVLFAFCATSVTAGLARSGGRSEVRTCAAVAAGLVLCTAGWGAVVLAVPDEVGRLAFGSSWRGVREVLPWTLLEYLALSLSVAGAVGLRVRRQAASVVTAQVLRSALALGGGLTVVLLAGSAPAVAQVLAAAAVTGGTWTWWRLLRGGGSQAGTGVEQARLVPSGPQHSSVGPET